MTNSVTKPMRSDAIRTRKLLMEAAATAFAEQGVEASISEIAERAGIGKGTVFRHFSTKEDLLASVVSENQNTLVTIGERLAQTAAPAEALLEFMAAAIELQISNRAFCQVAHGEARNHPDVRNGLAALDAITTTLTDRARAHGAIRQDITGQDVMLLMSGIFQTASPLLPTQPHLWRRYLRLVFDGMQAETLALPGPAPEG
ncbi:MULTISPECIES: TetR/AcrR family transcriptional regulator [Streptomyces]|nr:TetR/AcrR family transcriptional regulator [Streptomyces canarius]